MAEEIDPKHLETLDITKEGSNSARKSSNASVNVSQIDEKRRASVVESIANGTLEEIEVEKGYVAAKDVQGLAKEVPLGEGIIPDDDDEVIDPRLKDYPIPLVARTVDLKNDPTEPILTFRFWVLSTFWVLVGCGLSTFYYFKPYTTTITSYAVQLLSWGMGDAMARYLPSREINWFGFKWNPNPGPWNAKEHALIVVAYWGSCYTAIGLGPLSAIELYYGKKLNAFWSIVFLQATQMIGYGFSGLYRDILVRPPKLYWPGVLPNVALFNSMHKNPSVTAKSLKYFVTVMCCAFVYEWFPQLIFPLLGSLPFICWFGHGHWKPFVVGSGTYGFGMLTLSLDWNYVSFLQPLYTPLWANVNSGLFAMFCIWILYPIIYFTNTMNALTFAPMDTGTYLANGSTYDPTQVMTADFQLNRTALAEYGRPYWAPSYVFYWFWGFAALSASLTYALLWYGPLTYESFRDMWKLKRSDNDYNDPYLKIMSYQKRVPHWWYLLLLGICTAFAIAQLYMGDMHLPWWGFLVICFISFILTWPNGITGALANIAIGMSLLSDLIAGALFPGQPTAVLAAQTYSKTILQQILNLISDYKFGFYMKIPEREMFWGQIWGTFLGPFVNYGFMQLIIDHERPYLIGQKSSVAWDAVNTRYYYSTSMIWGVLGPHEFFKGEYEWVYWSFLIGPALTLAVWLVHRKKPNWDLEHCFNPTLIFYGGMFFPYYTTSNFLTSFIVSLVFMGYIYRYKPVWFRKFNYLTGVGLDCGTQLMTLACVFIVDLPNLNFPTWWGNAQYSDRCFPPADLPANALN